MYRIGYIDDQPTQYELYKKKFKRRYDDVELILLEDCKTREEFLDKIYEERVEVLLIDYKMAGTFGFNGSTLINYINDQIRDLECFILSAVERDKISDGIVATRNTFSKDIFDTEGDDEKRLKDFYAFADMLRESAGVFKKRSEQKLQDYKKLLEKKKQNMLSLPEEEEYRRLYKVLSSYGYIEKLPNEMLTSDFEQKIDSLLEIGNAILKKYE